MTCDQREHGSGQKKGARLKEGFSFAVISALACALCENAKRFAPKKGRAGVDHTDPAPARVNLVGFSFIP